MRTNNTPSFNIGTLVEQREKCAETKKTFRVAKHGRLTIDKKQPNAFIESKENQIFIKMLIEIHFVDRICSFFRFWVNYLTKWHKIESVQ